MGYASIKILNSLYYIERGDCPQGTADFVKPYNRLDTKEIERSAQYEGLVRAMKRL